MCIILCNLQCLLYCLCTAQSHTCFKHQLIARLPERAKKQTRCYSNWDVNGSLDVWPVTLTVKLQLFWFWVVFLNWKCVYFSVHKCLYSMYLQHFITVWVCGSMYSIRLSLTHSLPFSWTSWCLQASLWKAQVVDGWVHWAALEARLTGDIYEGVSVWACVRDWQGRGLSDIGLSISRQESTTPTTPHPKGQAL